MGSPAPDRLARTLVRDELFDLSLYRRLRERTAGDLQRVLDELIPIETRHFAFWKTIGINMIRQEEPVVVYRAPKRTFQNLHSLSNLTDLLGNCDKASVERFERELDIEHALHRPSHP